MDLKQQSNGINKTGILLNNLRDGQHLQLLQLVDCIYVRDNITPHRIRLPIFSIHDMSYHVGSIITIDLDNTDFALKCNGPFDIIFIPWDLEWLRQPLDFKKSASIYRSAHKLIARSISHGLAIQNYCNRKPDGYTKCSENVL